MTGSGFAMTANSAFEGLIEKREAPDLRPSDRRQEAKRSIRSDGKYNRGSGFTHGTNTRGKVQLN